jgi:hypothetical protein
MEIYHRRIKENSVFSEDVIIRMVGYSSRSLCAQAELYYYDFIFNNGSSTIPLPIADHINGCRYCQEQIEKFKSLISQAKGQPDSKENRLNFAKSIFLGLHFAYIGKRVTCKTVKPFLPTLLKPALEVKIPTPITVHLDKCQQCSDDLETIRNLGLSLKQLRRLSQLFAETSSSDRTSCTETQDAILAVLAVALMDFENTNEDALKHICICPECRNKLYQHRDSVIKELLHNSTGQEQFCYQDIPQADIFDYVIPYGLDPANDQYAKFRPSLTSHLRVCPICLAKMQKLHNAVYVIAERSESEVVTIYHVDKSAKTQSVNESDDLYSGFPIRVEIAEGGETTEVQQQTSTVDFVTALKKKTSEKTIKLLFKVAIVAAVILIGFTLLFNIPTAKAVTIEQICNALGRIKNVHILSFTADRKEPVQELWVSRTLNIFMTKTDSESVLSDISKGIRRSKQAGVDIIETASLPDDVAANIRKAINGFLGLVPFNDISEIPTNAKWEREAKEGLGTKGEDTDIYNLIWLDKTRSGKEISFKWRVFVNPETMLPKKVEIYEKSPSDEGFTLTSIKVVEYLSEDGIKSSIEKLSL